ncbi:quinone oxidoreductase family protein [Vitreimonas flagellata]|uniref:quinone oxidoreductase family protein n=1 Tax=Vitreimonas flagellata TaxID=2560861 RepID=UPI001075359B|nr:quinone oxidoreductase [Vitreimonas flagellata]
MKAIRVEEVGGPDVMRLVDVEEPALKPNEIRVRIHAIGVNFIDTYHRGGLYKLPMPTGIGQEFAGVVEAIGERVTRFQIGDRVASGTAPVGAYAETHTLLETRAVHVPQAISFDVAASAMLKGMTARYLLRKTFRVKRGDVVVIHAAAGGVGQIAVQWAKHLGAIVIAVVGSDAKAEIATALGADHVIVQARDDIAKRVGEITNGEGAHVVYDGVGKDTFMASIDSLRPLGMMVSYGNASGPAPEFSPLLLAQKGSLFLTRPTLNHYTASVADLDETAADLFEVIGLGAVKIAPPTRYALADAVQAHRDLEARKTTGSLVLVP